MANYTRTGRMVETTDLAIGDLIVTRFYGPDASGEWREYTEVARVTELGQEDGKYMPGFAYVVMSSDHPTAQVPRLVCDDEARPWDEFEIATSA